MKHTRVLIDDCYTHSTRLTISVNYPTVYSRCSKCVNTHTHTHTHKPAVAFSIRWQQLSADNTVCCRLRGIKPVANDHARAYIGDCTVILPPNRRRHRAARRYESMSPADSSLTEAYRWCSHLANASKVMDSLRLRPLTTVAAMHVNGGFDFWHGASY